MSRSAIRIPDRSVRSHPALRLCLAVVCALSLVAGTRATKGSPDPVAGRAGMVASSHPLATDVGVSILRNGGNAVDAAVAVTHALGVVEPWNAGLGGGAFVLIRMNDGRSAAIDGREVAPEKASRDMYLDARGEPTEDSRTGPRAMGVPGTAAALETARRKFGTKPLAELLAPAIALARNGYPVGERMAGAIAQSKDRIGRYTEWARTYLVEGEAPEPDHVLKQTDLADSYAQLAKEGPGALYGGALGKAVATDVRALGGILSQKDLRNYRPVEREPLRGTYRGYAVLAFPPPAGGAVVVEILNLIEPYDLSKLGAGSPAAVHLMAEAMKRAFADRAAYLGDPGVVKVPTEGLVSKAYAKRRGSGIDPRKATPVAGGGDPFGAEGGNTTHFSVIDREGNAVSVTQSLNLPFGSGIVAKGTGIVMNDEMDDFSAKPGVPNAYGLVGSEANAIAPGKRPLSSMSPTILTREGKAALIVGSPGGPRIITAVVETIVNVIDFGMDPQAAVDAPRFHHQWKPNVLAVEQGTQQRVIEDLMGRGHQVLPMRPWSSVQAITIDHATGVRRGGSDARTAGKAAAD
ncbi:MAG: gamma-glutamyltransferase [Deltaproteobacteria bacterium]|nr:gamma-glutamyltransferase [Deltaproteobacteria bacterium]